MHRYQLVIVDHVNIAAILAPLSWLGLCSYVVWLCGIEVFAPRPDFEGKLGLKNASKRIAISEYTLKNVKKRFPQLAIEVCDLGLDPAHWQKAGQPFAKEMLEFESVNGKRFKISHKLILHVGRMASGERYKGQESLLRAFQLVKAQFSEAQLMLVGQGDDREHLLSIACTFPEEVQDSIFMPGFLASERLNQAYQSCFVFAMPSVGEGFGLVYLEAMARAKPCLGGNVDASPYVIRDSITGFLVDDPKDHVQVATSLLRFFSDTQRAEAMGQAGYNLVKSYYLPEHFAKRLWLALGIDA
jgi:glycosyltransferase involved in cell wall biosynthesis